MKKLLLILLLVTTSVIVNAQYNGNDFSISANANYTTTSKIFLTPNAADEFLRNKNFPIEDIISYSFELRYRLSEPVILGLGAEYINDGADGRNLTSPLFLVSDGFEVIPIELSVYYFFPFSTENFKFYMGGGIGFYFGKHLRTFGDVEFEHVKSSNGIGLQMSLGMDYLVFDFLSVRSEMRFRDPKFDVTSKYNSDTVFYEDRLSTDEINTKINIDGITFRIGAVFHVNLF
ncbi:MAG: outer membrane beta-barrel protein [Ignavibacteriae bacterium]|nr:outer membrane beta-barrel protein [Ignavibacteriota bacterium]